MKTSQLLTWAVLLGAGYFAYTLVKGKKPCNCKEETTSINGGSTQEITDDLLTSRMNGTKEMVDRSIIRFKNYHL